MEIELCEPIRELYKDEVRSLAEFLEVPVLGALTLVTTYLVSTTSGRVAAFIPIISSSVPFPVLFPGI